MGTKVWGIAVVRNGDDAPAVPLGPPFFFDWVDCAPPGSDAHGSGSSDTRHPHELLRSRSPRLVQAAEMLGQGRQTPRTDALDHVKGDQVVPVPHTQRTHPSIVVYSEWIFHQAVQNSLQFFLPF